MPRRYLNVAFVVSIAVITGLVLPVVLNMDNPDDDTTQQVIAASWAQYGNMAELHAEADLIAAGIIGGTTEEGEEKIGEPRWGADYLYYTDFSFKVEQVIKGKEVKEIAIHQIGMSGEVQLADDPLFRLDENWILFLREYEPNKYFVLGGPQGRFKVIEGKVFSMDHVLPEEVMLPTDKTLEANGMDKEEFIQIIQDTKN